MANGVEIQEEDIQELVESFEEAGEPLDAEGIQEAKEDLQHPPFPIKIFLVAFAYDALQIIGALLVVGVLITIPVQIVFWLILFYWTWSRISGGWWKKPAMKILWKKYIQKVWVRLTVAMGIEFLPFIGAFIPLNTIFILMAWRNESDIVKRFEAMLAAVEP
ncbi:MAG: hypothetical protein AAB538_03940 [Patescibacteria group bacterium]